jgi:hypothetical protein
MIVADLYAGMERRPMLRFATKRGGRVFPGKLPRFAALAAASSERRLSIGRGFRHKADA